MNFYTYEVTTTQKCDMACTYCFEGEELKNPALQRSDNEIIKSVYDLLENKKFRLKFDGIKLNFWGGEPTLNVKFIVKLFKEFVNQPVNFFFYTNGFNALNIQTIIQQSKIFDSNRLSFQISYDGISHDKERIDHSGKGTSERILSNIKYLKEKFPEYQLSLKSTLPIHELYRLSEHWDSWKDLILEFNDFSWSPTLEYTQSYDITPEFVDIIEKQMLIIAKKEIKFYKKHNRFVWNWFTVKDKALCSAGANISNVDIAGNVSVCHGALYSKDKESMLFGHITDPDIAKKIVDASYKFSSAMNMSDHCKNCIATVCYQCPVVNFEYSSKEGLDRYYDQKTDLCSIYQTFGKISRTVNNYLKG